MKTSDSKTAATQVTMMQRLSQAAAGWLAGVSSRTLRDALDLPRGPGGTYDARAVVKWFTGRRPRAEALTDDEEEPAAAARRAHWPRSGNKRRRSFHYRRMRAAHGDAVLLSLLDLILRQWREDMAEYRQFDGDPKHREEKAAAERQRLADQAARRAFTLPAFATSAVNFAAGGSGSSPTRPAILSQ